MNSRVVWFALAMQFALSAQTERVSLEGLVTDQSGSAIPGTVVTAVQNTSAVRSTQTDDQGHYRLTGLPAGSYAVQATAKGFAPFESPTVPIVAGRVKTIDISLSIQIETQQITVAEIPKVDVDPASNAGALVLHGADLDALPDDPDDLAADLTALAGPSIGPNGGQIFIDGFTGGRLPAKGAIREIRVNQNPFAAQFDRPGFGRIEILTKPGTDEFHGDLLFQFSDDHFNSRNPFVTVKPPYQRRQWEGEVSGPIGKKTSFFLDFERRDINENSFINALILDQSFAITPFSQAVVTPLASSEINFKIDRQLSTNHTLSARYQFARDARDNQGVGGFNLATRAYQNRNAEDTITVIETGVLSSQIINETRLRYRRQRTDQTGGSTVPTISVLDAFTSGGAPFLSSHNHQEQYEVQNYTSLLQGAHVFRLGGRLRGVSLTDQSTQNYAGTFTFTSLASYQATLLGLQAGLSPTAIRAAGGGASQFSLSAGTPLAGISQQDLSFFAQDDWRLRPNVTVSLGLRYEFQTNLSDYADIAPRASVAWGLGSGKAKTPRTVLRAGFGIFYDRVSESLRLDTLRLNGIAQQQFVVPFPDFYPIIPTASQLNSNQQPQNIRNIDSALRAPTLGQGTVALERQLPKNITLSVSYTYSRGVHSLRSRNLNAPLPDSGLFPYGSSNNLYYYESSGVFRQRQLVTNLNARISPKLTITGFYAFNHALSNTDGAATFPANSDDLSTEYGRAAFDVRHRVLLTGSLAARWGLRISPFLVASSGLPFNITVGRDVNGDSLYTDRPAFATDLTRASVVRTSFGAFDLQPLPGQTLIPRNYGEGSPQFAVNVRLSKTVKFGEKAGAKNKTGGSGGAKELVLGVNARNLFNHPNLALPVGNLSSALFGQSIAVATAGGNGAGGNRRVDLQARFNF